MNPAAPYVFGAWLLGWPVAARLMYHYGNKTSEPQPWDRVMTGVAALFWPFAAAVALAMVLLALPTLGVRTPAERARRAVARHQERERLRQRIAELERDLGMKP